MELRYYQYRLGTAKLISGEMHAVLHQFKFDQDLNKYPFIDQILKCINTDSQAKILLRHVRRGINISDEKNTRLISTPDFPIKSFEPGYFNFEKVDNGLSGGDFDTYPPNHLVESYYYFWETKHPFSQWHKCNFQADGIEFNSAEQFMMYEKSKLFGDNINAEKILKSKDVRDQKMLGRQVMGFDKAIWELNAPKIVYCGNKEKFSQNKEFLNLLISTSGKTIVEASPTDTIWGIGLTQDHEHAKSIFTWKGTNWLGAILTELREDFINQQFDNY